MTNSRNRASGWKHAKLSGHSNEIAIENLITSDLDEQAYLLSRTCGKDCKISQIKTGGLNESNVDSLFQNQKTKSKTDLQIILQDNSYLNISIKKSAGGQVYLIKDDRFINGFQLHYNKIIPLEVKRAIELFWGSATDVGEIISKYGDQATRKYEVRKNRLVASTLLKYDPYIYESLLKWFIENSQDIADFCFSRGLAKESRDWANWIWYKNLVDKEPIDEIFSVDSISNYSDLVAKKETFYGNRGGGTTIQLPFGFVQWHQGQMQFHHNLKKLLLLTNKTSN